MKLRRRYVVAVAALLLIGGAAAAYRFRKPSGNALVFINSTETKTPGGYYQQQYSYGFPVLELDGPDELKLRSFRLVDPPEGLKLDAAYAVDRCEPGSFGKVGSDTGDATKLHPGITGHPIRGTVVKAGKPCWYILVVMHAERPGTYHVPAGELRYTHGWWPQERQQRIPHAITLTAGPKGPDPRYCRQLQELGRPCPTD